MYRAGAIDAPAYFLRIQPKTAPSGDRAPADIPFRHQKTLETFPKISQGKPEHQRLIKQATV
jgi:hypothetical protein